MAPLSRRFNFVSRKQIIWCNKLLSACSKLLFISNYKLFVLNSLFIVNIDFMTIKTIACMSEVNSVTLPDSH